jgi:hypothetical protein
VPHHKQERVTQVTDKDYPSKWKSLLIGRYVPACQKTCIPYLNKDDNLWKIVIYDTINKEHLIYEFKSKSFRKPLYHASRIK